MRWARALPLAQVLAYCFCFFTNTNTAAAAATKDPIIGRTYHWWPGRRREAGRLGRPSAVPRGRGGRVSAFLLVAC
jgi:hypothetical protein